MLPTDKIISEKNHKFWVKSLSSFDLDMRPAIVQVWNILLESKKGGILEPISETFYIA